MAENVDLPGVYRIEARDEAILAFRGEHGYLSNFYRSPVEVEGQECATVEHAFQMLKTLDPATREAIRLKANPQWAKQATRAKSFVTREGWGDMRVGVMRELVTQKFVRHPRLAAKLASTGDRPIIELNTWSDFFWGMVEQDGQLVGENHLGIILMEVRGIVTSAA